MKVFQESLVLSPHLSLYDMLIPKDHFLRQMNELVDFSFINEALAGCYSNEMGRLPIPPIQMFKYLLLKELSNLSDRDLMERARYDLSYKYFLDLAPEDPVADYTTLSKFRTIRLKDVRLLNTLIQKTADIALELGIIKSKTMLVDSTHSKSRFQAYSPQDILYKRAKKLRQAIYQANESAKESMPKKVQTDDIQAAIDYCQTLVDWTDQQTHLQLNSEVTERANYLKELLEEDINHLKSESDRDAKTGYKSAEKPFWGYKIHFAMNSERIITACLVTSGEKSDSEQFNELYQKTLEHGFLVDTVIGDRAYSSNEIHKTLTKDEVKLISKVTPVASQGNRKPDSFASNFTYNKDSELYVCPNGQQAIKKRVCKSNNKKTIDYSILLI